MRTPTDFCATRKKGTDFSVHTQEHLDAVARELNERPRMAMIYYSPAEKFEECVAAIC